MQKHLYFVCPSDYLETVIDKTFRQENYYCTSLGNSMVFDLDTVEEIIKLLKSKNINEVSFVLSDDNSIVQDALEKQDFSGITVLNDFYDKIIAHQEHSEVSWQICNRKFLILSYHLNNKIKELKLGLKTIYFNGLKINGLIYKRQENIFQDIYSDLICREFFYLN
ncbi:MAG: hypothetical protein AAFZ15_00515 [Bacteroidota bacterium]